MKRNEGIEAMRAFAILGMLIYHYSVSISGLVTSDAIVQVVREEIGQISLISFFVLSGFGSYIFFRNAECKGTSVSWHEYAKKRFMKLAPPYYICILFLVLFTSRINCLNYNWLKHLITSILLIHNYDVGGTINGVTWTIATLFQLYFFAKFIYQMVSRGKWIYCGLIQLAVIMIKFCGANYLVNAGAPDIWRVVLAIRTPVTTIDLLMVGMIGGHLLTIKKLKIEFKMLILLLSCMLAGYFPLFYFWSTRIGIYGVSFLSNCSQTVIGWYVALIIFFAACGDWELNSIFGKFIKTVGKNEYGIFLWHMILLGNLLENSPDWYVYLDARFPYLLMILIISICIAVGRVYMRMVSYAFFRGEK